MDVPKDDILKHLLERLDKTDKHQQKLDQMMTRLDTLPDILEKQNRIQYVLNEKLVQITTQFQQEKYDVREQLQEALQEIVQPTPGSDSKEECSPSPHRTSQSLQSLGKQIGDKLKSIDDRANHSAKIGQQLILLSQKMEGKLTELAGNSVDMKTFLAETRNVNDLIRGMTISEVTRIHNRTDEKLSDSASVVSKNCQQETEAKEEEILSTGEPLKTSTQQLKQQDNTEPLSDTPKLTTTICDKQMQVILDLDRKIEQINSSVLDAKKSLDAILTYNKQSSIDLENTMSNGMYELNKNSKEQSLLINETLKSELKVVQEELQTNRETFITESNNHSRGVISAFETIKDHLGQFIQTDEDCISKYKVELENIYSLINSLSEIIQRNMTSTLQNADCTEASMISRPTIMIKQIEDLPTHTQMNKLLETLTIDLKDYILKTKRELYAVTKKEAQTVGARIHEPLMSLMEKVVTGSETQSSRIINTVETAKEDLRHLILTEGENTNKYKMELGSFHSSVSSILDGIQGNVKTVLEKVDSTEASMIERHSTVVKEIKDLSTQTKMNKQLKDLSNDLKDCLYQTKREIFAVTEKEAQIVRDRIQGPLVSLGNYTFDFYVDNFTTFVRSGRGFHSVPWHINELQTCVTGFVRLLPDGEMQVWLLHGRHAHKLGLQPRSGKSLKIKASICDINKKKLQPSDIGENRMSLNEATIPGNGDWGVKIGVTSCDELLERGYGEQEGYKRGALLIRYDVTVE